MNRQQTWKWLALGNFVLGGSGAGAYVVTSAVALSSGEVSQAASNLIILAAVALVVSGLGCVTLEAGKKSHAINVFRNVRTSWMSREAVAASLFVLFGIAEYMWPNPAFHVLAFLSAAALLVSHGFILFAARAIPAWNTALAPPLVWSSSLTAGSAVVGVAFILQGLLPGALLLWCIMLTSAAMTAITAIYLYSPGATQGFKEAMSTDRGRGLLGLSMLVGGILPLVLMNADSTWLVTFLASTVLLFAGSVFLKYLLILRVSYRIPVIQLKEQTYVFPARA